MNIGGRSLLSAALILCVVLMARAVTGSQTSVTGELVETYCWGTKQIGGPGHAQCGNAPLPAELIAQMGNQVTIRGEVFARGGTQLLKVQSWSRAR